MKLVLSFILCLLAQWHYGQTANLEQLTTSNGELVSVDSIVQTEQYKVLVFWSETCPHCQKEIKALSSFSQNWYEAFNTPIYLIAASNYPKAVYENNEYIDRMRGEGYYFLHDQNLQGLKHFDGVGVPLTILLDDTGQIVRQWQGYDAWMFSNLEMYLKKAKQKKANAY